MKKDVLNTVYNSGPTFDVLEGSKWQEFSKNKITTCLLMAWPPTD